MNARQILFRVPLSTFAITLFCLSFVAVANAQSSDAQKPKIKNFGQMDVRFYRGAQPEESDYKDLAALGIKTIIDLRDDPERYARHAAEEAGMHYVNIPMSDTDRPSEEAIEEFLKIAGNPFAGKFYVHCKGGRHRTGLMGAVYRMNFYRWDFKQAYKEMKDYDFYTRWGHGVIKDYVQDYFDRMQTRAVEVSTGTAK
ncbi:MAG TPA: tyrosine-protein phosphatase [Blastocatellia bacterium]|jgi:protein tyrosine/serine phosphatase